MNRKITTIAILILALLGFSAQTAVAQNGKNRLDPGKSRLERKVRKEILSLPYYGVFDIIGYEVKGNRVTLSGYVVRPLTKKEAADAVADIEGVAKVVNKIKILPPSPSDDRIRARIYRALANRGGLYRYLLGSNPSIRIIVNHGRVTLEGFVTYESDKTLATVAATEIFGVFSVKNNLQVERKQR